MNSSPNFAGRSARERSNKSAFHKALAAYDYAFSRASVAQEPARPRDAAKLLVFSREKKRVRVDRFSHLSRYLPPRAVLVFNDSKVLPARLTFRKETGGKVGALSTGYARGEVRVLADRRLLPGTKLFLDRQTSFVVRGNEGKFFLLRPLFPVSRLPHVMAHYGKTPLPPYLRRSPLSESVRRTSYQTVFARVPGSIAAPAASLHFTRRLLKKLRQSGCGLQFVTLHAGLGTFAPLEERQMRDGTLHRERYAMSRATLRALNRAKRGGRPIVAVGTTVVRALESSADRTGRLRTLRGTTALFIREGYRFKFVDGIITNFHVPRSSLLMLVAAFVGRRTLASLYRAALKQQFKIFSFGDGMLILNA